MAGRRNQKHGWRNILGVEFTLTVKRDEDSKDALHNAVCKRQYKNKIIRNEGSSKNVKLWRIYIYEATLSDDSASSVARINAKRYCVTTMSWR